MRLRRDSHVAMHRQLAQQLRQAIAGGGYRPGDRLPTEPELAARHAVSRITARQAVMQLPTLRFLGKKEVTLGIRPSGVRLAAEGLPATVTMCEALGEDLFADLMVGERLVRAKLNGHARPTEHSTVKIALDGTALHVFDRQSGARL